MNESHCNERGTRSEQDRLTCNFFENSAHYFRQIICQYLHHNTKCHKSKTMNIGGKCKPRNFEEYKKDQIKVHKVNKEKDSHFSCNVTIQSQTRRSFLTSNLANILQVVSADMSFKERKGCVSC